MTIISNKSILTLSITAILVAGVFVMSPNLVDAATKLKQPFTTYTLTSLIVVPAGDTGQVSMNCEGSDLVLSSGYRSPSDGSVVVSQSVPGPGQFWTFEAVNNGVAPASFLGMVLCADTSDPQHVP